MEPKDHAEKLTDLHIKVLEEILKGEHWQAIKDKFATAFASLDYEEIIINKAHRLTFDDDGHLIGAYPVCPLPTDHKITVAGIGTGYAMCAVDALGAAYTFNAPVTIESTVAGSDSKLELTISPTDDPPSSTEVVAYNPLSYDSLQELVADNAQLAVDACPSINFYSSTSEVPEHLVSLDFTTALQESRAIFDRAAIHRHILSAITQ